jgi:small-conductance mechanosensitive channel
MKFIKLVVGLSIFFLLSSEAGFGQKRKISSNKDSVNAAILHEYQVKLAEIEQQRLADSMQKVVLESRLNALNTTDNLTKEKLQKQLQDLNNKDSARIAKKKAQIDSLRSGAVAYPVRGFFDDTLFLIYNKLGSFSAKDRANAISDRISQIKSDFSFKPDSLKLSESESSFDIVYNGKIIVSVTENDALWQSTNRKELAIKYKKIISDAIMLYKSQTSVISILKSAALALLIIAIIAALIVYTRKLFVWTALKIEQQEDALIKGIKIREYVLFDASRQVKILLMLNTILKWFITLLIVYITLPILFGLFPWTRNFANTLFEFILNPVKGIALGLWNYLPDLITIIVILFIFHYVFKGLKFLKTEIEKGDLTLPGFYPDWANPTYQIIRVMVTAFEIVVIFPYLPGSDSPVFRGVSVFLGFLFTFGSAGSLSNIMAGLILTYMRLFKIGDRVKIGEVTGDVIEKSLLVTRIRTIKNEIISIPNSTVMSSHTINYSSDAPEKGLIIHTTVTIGYDVPWRDMHQALIDAASKTELVLTKPKPFVLQTSLDDFYVSYQVNAYVHEANMQAAIYSELHQNIQDVCNERGIEILSPHYRAERDGNMTSIPASYLSKDYKAPSFNIKVQKDTSDTKTK